MVTLVFEDGDLRGRTLALVRGPNLVGRAADCTVVIDHPTVSGHHCELQVSEFGVRVRELGSSNGTFVDGVPVASEAYLRDGQILGLGGVHLRVIIPPVRIAIPELSAPEAEKPAFTPEGMPACWNHRDTLATHVCTRCGRTFCAACVHGLRVEGGPLRLLCPACSHPCEALEAAGAGRRLNTFWARVAREVRRAFDFRRPPRRS